MRPLTRRAFVGLATVGTMAASRAFGEQNGDCRPRVTYAEGKEGPTCPSTYPTSRRAGRYLVLRGPPGPSHGPPQRRPDSGAHAPVESSDGRESIRTGRRRCGGAGRGQRTRRCERQGRPLAQSVLAVAALAGVRQPRRLRRGFRGPLLRLLESGFHPVERYKARAGHLPAERKAGQSAQAVDPGILPDLAEASRADAGPAGAQP